jgi:Putative metallopeptidase
MAGFQLAARVLLVLIGLSGDSVLAQPFRAHTDSPRPPSPEAQQSFQATIDEQARLLAADPRLSRVPKDKQHALVEFVVGNLLFVAMRELGHAVMSEIRLPLVGGTEQAFDDFAVLSALKVGERSFSDRILIEGAKGWFTRAREKRAKRAPDYYDRHEFNARRAYRVVCLMFGADAARFKALPEETALPEELRRGCGWDYDKVSRSWDAALMPHRPAAGQPKARIAVSYGVAAGDLEVYAQVLRNLRFLETIAEFAADRLAWRDPIRIELQSCGEADAAWTAPTRTLHLCYEMARDFAELYRDLGRDP